MPTVMSRPFPAVRGQDCPSTRHGSGWRDTATAGLSLFNDLYLRVAKPFEELTEDACEATASWLPGRLLPSRGRPLALPDVEVHGKASALEMAWLHELRDGSHALLDRAALPLLELSEDAGPGGALALLATVGPAASVAAGGKALLVLCGLSAHTKGLYALLGFAMAGGAASMWNRHSEEEGDRTLQWRSATALMCSSVVHFALAMGCGIPPSISTHVAHPEVFARFLPDVFIVPVMILNIGYLAGRKADQMLPTMGFGLLSAVSLAAAAAAANEEALPLLATGVACMCKAAFDINRVLPVTAGSLSAVNKLRTQISADLMVFAWLGYPLVEGLGMTNCISLPVELHAYVALDLLGKLGVSHIVLRSHDAYMNAQRAVALEVRQLDP